MSDAIGNWDVRQLSKMANAIWFPSANARIEFHGVWGPPRSMHGQWNSRATTFRFASSHASVAQKKDDSRPRASRKRAVQASSLQVPSNYGVVSLARERARPERSLH